MADFKKWFPFRFPRQHPRTADVPVRTPTAVPARMHDWRDEMDRMFERLWTDPFAALDTRSRWFGDFSKAEFLPTLDVSDDKDSLRITLEVPGVDREDIDIEVADGVMTISGEKKHEQSSDEEGCYRIERSYGSFKRSIPLPTEVDTEHSEATFDKGVLTVTVPKTKEAKKPKRKVAVRG